MTTIVAVKVVVDPTMRSTQTWTITATGTIPKPKDCFTSCVLYWDGDRLMIQLDVSVSVEQILEW